MLVLHVLRYFLFRRATRVLCLCKLLILVHRYVNLERAVLLHGFAIITLIVA